MILPSKNLSEERALLTVGGKIISQLDRELSVSELWYRMKTLYRFEKHTLTFDWFISALVMLYTISAVELESGLIRRSTPNAS